MIRLALFNFTALLLFVSNLATADITLDTPSNNDVYQTRQCPIAPCTADIPLQVSYTGQQVEQIQVIFTRREDGQKHERILCRFDQIEGTSCASPPIKFNTATILQKGTWKATPVAIRSGRRYFGNSVKFKVNENELPPAGPVRLIRVEPKRAASRVLLRDAGNGNTELYSASEHVKIIGKNLDKNTNPFLEVYLSPIPIPDPDLTSASGLPTGEWCKYKAEIKNSGTLPNGESYLEVQVPDLPPTTPDRCTLPPRQEHSIFATKWRWIIRDKWIREQREHMDWAINSPRDVPWKDAPPFRIKKPEYPLINGFGFPNESDSASYNEFLSVFGNNAYVCIDCAPIVGCACILPRIPDPLYHILWYRIYKKYISTTPGSCNGMSATSLLFARNELETEQFNPLVHYPAGFTSSGKPATYKDSNFCTPYCSPPKPKNLWANIRMNHGVQFSREFLLEAIDTLGEAIIDPDTGEALNGVPNATKSRIKDNPQGYVTCFFSLGNGHCVTPYAVAGDTIYIYDNKHPLDTNREIIISGGDYSYPTRTSSPNHGNAIVAFPISIWKKGRHVFGLSDIKKIFNGEIVKFLMSIVVGDAEMEVVTEKGSLGFNKNGARTDFIQGGFLVPLMGPSNHEQRQLPALIAMNQSAPLIRIHSKGENYTYHTAAGGYIIQLISNSAKNGNEDKVQLEYKDQSLSGVTFEPEDNADRITPQVGLAVADGERALFRFSGIKVPAKRTVSFGGDIKHRSVRFKNNTGSSSNPVITLDRTGGDYVRISFGPIDVPNGATHELILQDWPNVATVTSTIDLDGDGNPDRSETITGRPLPTPINLDKTSDLSVSLKATEPSLQDRIAFDVSIKNTGPDIAKDVVAQVVVNEGHDLKLEQGTGGRCEKVNGQYQCSFAELAAGNIQSLRFESVNNVPIITATATVYSSSRDSDVSNDTYTESFGKQNTNILNMKWWIILVIIILLIVVLYIRKIKR